MYQGFRFMDADAHILEPRDLFEKYLEPRFRTSYMPRTRTGYAGEPLAFCIEVITPSERCDGAGCTMPFGRDAGDPALVQAATDLVLPGHDAAYAELARHNFQSESFPAALDRAGIDRMVVYPTCGLWYTQDPHLDAAPAAAYRRAYNQWLHDFCQAAGGRVIGAASVDLRDAETAAREARRCVHDFGFRAVHINPAPVSPYPLYHDFYEPLWTALEDCDVPLAVHTGAGSPTDEMLYLYLPASMARPEFRLAMRAAQTTVAFTIGNMIASAALIMGGVLERHPRLKVVHLETGAGWASFWLDRLEAGIQGGNRG
jgi:predicted TIM-barrel fold metal-dependent hydrolase